jgi:lipopolysaccharide transport system permease protein
MDARTSVEHEHWDRVIEPHGRLFDLKLREVWHYRDLLILLVRRDFVSFYKQTILGPVWFFIQPLFITITYTLVFGKMAGISTDGLPAPLFYMTGITAWNYFSECLTKTSSVFRDNSQVFGKVYFPRLIMPLSIVISNLIKLAVQLLLLFAMMGFYALKGASFHVTAYLLLLPVLIVQLALLGLGTGMIVSALTNRYRDLIFLVTFGVQLMMYTTTVVYPLSSVPLKYKWLIELNPITMIIEVFRRALLGQGTFTALSFGLSFLATLLIAAGGILIFNRVERNFIDNV